MNLNLQFGQVDCVVEYNGKLSVIDFKTVNKERQESWIDNYSYKLRSCAQMYEETFGKNIDQIVILLVSEDGLVQNFVKEKKDYMESLMKSIDEFYKYYQEIKQR